MPRSMSFLLAVTLSAGIGSPSTSAQSPAVAMPVAGPAAVQYVKVEGVDYMFHLPTRFRPGLTVFNLVNVGRDVHSMTVLAMPADKTLHDFIEVYHPSGKLPGWVKSLGETPVLKAGEEGFVTLRLKPGNYLLACLLPASDGRSHAEVGMVQQITVR